ncbi:Protein of unknown function [Nocardia amikacinitolerans]|uniref:DUF742 domain-containing protein n=1 Tax=Nocardia amikacinitolerans TaxID=756689 RepID=A0A285KYD6_9NOCA|nr:DUF742 domain-containing protein [Nocardia amikacinitolerans]MCP2276244.1 Protein of unknown function (DUF742) [Nocardia amikacinitolerans]MCP2294508.1 Protein of unknown function (DUF742) [Nocardia amikacinitolerans]SNY77682.1 Protein of unknown function [Nocardia amikacinitolerans]
MSEGPDEVWGYEDDDPGPLVRPFALTRGRAGRDLPELDILTLVISVGYDSDVIQLDREYAQIFQLCRHQPMSIAEISAHLKLLLVTVKVLVSDLIAAGYVIFRSPPRPEAGADPELLQAVLDGIRNL